MIQIYELEEDIKRSYQLHYQPTLFTNIENAKGAAKYSEKPITIVKYGNDRFILVCPLDAKKLKRFGFSTI